MLSKSHRRVISYLLTAMMLAGLEALPNKILCIAPGGHIPLCEMYWLPQCCQSSGSRWLTAARSIPSQLEEAAYLVAVGNSAKTTIRILL